VSVQDLSPLLARARRESALWASLLAVLEVTEGTDSAELANRLSVPVRQVARLALCFRPRPGHEIEDLNETAQFIGAVPLDLAMIYRIAQAIEALTVPDNPVTLRHAARRPDDDE
jgi:hypothetical protein